MAQNIAQYQVPSQSNAQVRYTVVLFEGDARCNCPWGARSGDTPILCWHAQLAGCIHHALDLVDPLTDEAALQAQRGDFWRQIYIVRSLLDMALEQQKLGQAAECSKMLSKYLHALSFSGACPMAIKEEGASALSLAEFYQVA